MRFFVSEFKNENLSIKVEKLPGSNIKLDVTVTPQATQAAYAKALKNINKEIVLPGFRKGKAPNNLVIDKFKPQVEEEWRNVLLNTAFHEALELIKIFPLSQDTIKPQIKSISQETGSEFVISYEARPEVPNINPSDIKLKKVNPDQVTQKEIQDRLNELQLNQATWDDIEGRGIQENDYVSLDIESLDSPGVMLCKDETFVISKETIGTWLYNLLIGQNNHAVVEGVSEKEACQKCDDHDHDHVHAEEPEFKPSKLKITVKSIKKPILPEINEEFSKKIGAESVDVLHERVVSSLEKNARDRAQNNLRNQVSEIILKDYSFDIPASLLKSHGPSLSEQQKNEISNSYRLHFITQKIAHDLNLSVSEKEIMEEFMIQAYMTNPKESFIDPSSDPKEIHHRIETYLLEQKVKDYLIEHANKE